MIETRLATVIEWDWMKRGLDDPGCTKSIRIIAFCLSGGSKSNHWNLNIQAFEGKKMMISHTIIFYESKGMIISYNS